MHSVHSRRRGSRPSHSAQAGVAGEPEMAASRLVSPEAVEAGEAGEGGSSDGSTPTPAVGLTPVTPLDTTPSSPPETDADGLLRPRRLAEYVGQEKVKQNLSVFIQAALHRSEALDHVLLYGPPGLGKTTLAHIVAAELGVSLRITSGPAIERPGDLVALLTNLESRDVLFIDEIHRLRPVIEEVLYPGMEDFAVDIVLGKGPGARSLRLELPHFTLIGATTRAGMLTSPLRDRFGVICRLEFYTPVELAAILRRSARLLGIEATPAALAEIARRSRGTPRIANRLLKRVRDYAQVLGAGRIDQTAAEAALARLEVDPFGLDAVDRKLLRAMAEIFGGRPVGLETLAAVTAESPETVEDVYEPYLMQQGFLQRTPRGRQLTVRAYQQLPFLRPWRQQMQALLHPATSETGLQLPLVDPPADPPAPARGSDSQ